MGKMVSATEFKAKSLALIDEMQRTGEPLTVTRRGKPSVKLVAERADTPKPLILGALKGTVTIHGDIVGPVDPDWEAAFDAKWDQLGFRAPEDQTRNLDT